MTASRPAPPRPTEPLPGRPAGWLGLESYSSLRGFWGYLAAAQAAGRTVTLLRGDPESRCRRRIGGYGLPNAGGLLDDARVLAQLEDGLDPHPALLSLLGGDPRPLRGLLSVGYLLRADFSLGFTRGRELILRPELRYLPWEFAPPQARPLPRDLALTPRRFGREELRRLLERACGLA